MKVTAIKAENVMVNCKKLVQMTVEFSVGVRKPRQYTAHMLYSPLENHVTFEFNDERRRLDDMYDMLEQVCKAYGTLMYYGLEV